MSWADTSGPADARSFASRSAPSTGDQVLLGVSNLVESAARYAFELVCRFPIASGFLGAVLVAWWLHLWLALGIPVLVLAAAAVVVRLRWPARWHRWIGEPLRRWQCRRRLRRLWPSLCSRLGLTLTDRDRGTGVVTEWRPRLAHLRWSAEKTVLSGLVSLVEGQTVDDLAEVSDRIAAAAGAQWCRVRQSGTRAAWLLLLFGDPLAQIIPPLPVPDIPDLTALPLGMREDGTPWLVRLLGTHLLIVGVTGAGKGSVISSLLRALARAIAAGVVQVWAVDGKAGMELGPARKLFTRFATTVEDGVQLLEDAAAEMTARAARFADLGHRVNQPTVEEPMLLVLVDEVALLTAYMPDRKLRDRAERAIAVITTQGRAPAVVMVAALQDPRKEVLWVRNLFPTKIGMRLDEKAQVDMVLGDGAREAGADCHKIPETMPGVGYVKLDGHREPIRVRAAYLADADITALADQFPAPAHRQLQLVAKAG